MVNSNDFRDEEFEVQIDMLTDMFNEQFRLRDKYVEIENQNLPGIVPVKIPVDIDTCRGQQHVKEQLTRCIVEIVEAMDCLKNKPWKQSNVEVDVDHFHEELGDAIHFFIEACLLSGISPEMLFNIYMQKNRVNQFRQRSNY